MDSSSIVRCSHPGCSTYVSGGGDHPHCNKHRHHAKDTKEKAMTPLLSPPPPLVEIKEDKPAVKHINRRKVQEKALLNSITRKIIQKGMNKDTEKKTDTDAE